MNLTELFELYKNDIYRLAFSYTLNWQDSEDILQIVFIKFYKRVGSLTLSNEEVKKYLFKITVNESKRLLLTPWRKRRIIIDDFERTLEDTKNIKSDLINILSELNSIYRFPLFLYYYEGYSIKEISKILNVSESAVKARLTRGKEKLKLKMKGENNESY